MMEEQQKNATPEQRATVNFLRGKQGPKIRSGLLGGKRVDYFKGKGAIKAMLSPEYAKQKKVIKVTSELEAAEVLHQLIPCAFFLRVTRSETGSPKNLTITPQQQFPPEGLDYYVWFYEGSQFYTMLGAAGLVLLMLAGVMFPLWPYTLRLGVWYLSMGVLGLLAAFFAMSILRLIFYVVTLVVAKPGIWVFPRLFEDVSFMDSWTPLWAWDLPPKKKRSKDSSKSSSSSGEKKKKSSKGGSTKSSGSTTPVPVPVAQESSRIEEIPDEGN